MNKSSNGLIVVGAGGHATEVAQHVIDIYRDAAAQVILGFLDDDPEASGRLHPDHRFLGPISEHRVRPECEYVLAIGSPQARLRAVGLLGGKGARFATLIHPLASVATSALVGHGCIVGQFATIGPFARVGSYSVLGPYSLAAHQSRIGQYCVLSPFSAVTGKAMLEDGVFLGIYAGVAPGKQVGGFSKVAAASIVHRNIPAHSLAKGNPAIFRSIPKWGGDKSTSEPGDSSAS
jgi:sugar O-acyltransferase (sialic acid O-acetyltransferase NeuD family)